MPGNPASPPSLRRAIAAAGGAMGGAALMLIWGARLTVHRPVYVSELGADGEPTAGVFEVALLLIVASAATIAWAARGITSTAWILGRWTPSVSLGVTAALFFVASQVTCTAGCPLPVGDTFTLQDFVHTSAAVLAFAAASVAMLQTAFAEGRRMLRRLSFGAAVAVAIIAAAGGILSLLRFGTEVGSVMELIATTIGIGWAATFGFVLARDASAIGTARARTVPVARPREASAAQCSA